MKRLISELKRRGEIRRASSRGTVSGTRMKDIRAGQAKIIGTFKEVNPKALLLDAYFRNRGLFAYVAVFELKKGDWLGLFYLEGSCGDRNSLLVIDMRKYPDYNKAQVDFAHWCSKVRKNGYKKETQ